MRTPSLQTEGLILRPQFHATVEMVEWLSNPKNVVYSEQRHRKHTLASQQAYIRSFDHVNRHIWIMRRLENNEDAIGTITAYRDVINQVAEMGILIDHRWWGKGYGTQAWSAVMSYLLQDMRKVEAGTRADNLGMRRVMEHCEMKYEGYRPFHFLDDGNPHDLVQYGRLK